MPMNARLLRPRAAGGFNPKSIAGLQVWLDGSDSTTFTLNGSTVSEWRDKSGNSRHFSQATALRQPAVTAAAKSGKSAVAFTNDFMVSVYTYNVGSFFAVWEQPTTQLGDGNAGVLGARASNSGKVANGSLNMVLTTPYDSEPWPNNKIAFDPNPGGTMSARLNGVAQASGDMFTYVTGVGTRTSPDRWQHISLTFAPVSGSKTFVLGADPFGAASRFMQNGHIAEVLMYSTQLSASEVLRVERYLVAKWGLQ